MRGTVVVLILAVSFLAGCIGGDADEVETEGPSPGGEEATPTETLGSLSGTIVKADGFDPVAAAEVYILKDGETRETFTNAVGRYTFNNLEPGVYRMLVNAPCCRDHIEDVGVEAGQVTQTDIQLTVIRTVAAHVNRDGYWQGFISCGIMYPTAFQPINCSPFTQDANDNSREKFTADPGLKSIVIAMDWEPVQTNLNGALRVAIYLGEPGAQGQGALELEDGRPTIEFRLDAAEGADDLDWDEFLDPFEFTLRAWAGRGGDQVNVVYQQPFDLYYHLFYGEHAPEGYSALPDT